MMLLALVVSEIFQKHFVTAAADIDDSIKRNPIRLSLKQEVHHQVYHANGDERNATPLSPKCFRIRRRAFRLVLPDGGLLVETGIPVACFLFSAFAA